MFSKEFGKKTDTIGTNQKQPPKVFCKKDVLRNFAKFTGKHLCQRLIFNKESLAQVFSCEFYEIAPLLSNTFQI